MPTRSDGPYHEKLLMFDWPNSELSAPAPRVATRRAIAAALALAACSGRQPQGGEARMAELAPVPSPVMSVASRAPVKPPEKWRPPPPISDELEPAQTDFIPPAGYVVLASTASHVGVKLLHSRETPWAILRHTDAVCSSIAFWRWSGERLGHVPSLEAGAPTVGTVAPGRERRVVSLRSGRQGNTWLLMRTHDAGQHEEENVVDEIWEHDRSAWSLRKRFAEGVQVRFTLSRPAGGMLVATGGHDERNELRLELLGVDENVSAPRLPPAPELRCGSAFSNIHTGHYGPSGVLVLAGERCEQDGFTVARWDGREVTQVKLEHPLRKLNKRSGAFWVRIPSDRRVAVRAQTLENTTLEIVATFDRGSWTVREAPFDLSKIIRTREERKAFRQHHDAAKIRSSVTMKDFTRWLVVQRNHDAHQVVVSDGDAAKPVHLSLARNTCR